jgi:hypothetical protein
MTEFFVPLEPKDIPVPMRQSMRQAHVRTGLTGALRDLAVGEVIAVPSRQRQSIHALAHVVGIKVRTTLIDDVVYVGRVS